MAVESCLKLTKPLLNASLALCVAGWFWTVSAADWASRCEGQLRVMLVTRQGELSKHNISVWPYS